MAKVEKVPPDGGYGWIIVVAYALSNLILIPMIQNFGLIFKDTFNEIGLTATESSMILNLNAAFGMVMGLINGVLLKIFGYRKIALVAACFIFVGIVTTSRANSFAHFIVTYGLITSLGFGLNMSAYGLAVNSYFVEKKNKAIGLGTAIMGVGSILMPQLINFLLLFYEVQEVTLILGAISAHGFVAAFLLQPIKWHLKKKVKEPMLVENEEEEKGKGEVQIIFSRSVSQEQPERRMSEALRASLEELETAPVYGLETPFHGSMISLNTVVRNRKDSIISQSWKKASQQSLPPNRDSVYNPEMTKPIKKKSEWKLFLQRLANYFDLDLLNDPIYLNIMIGLSLAIFAEMNFSLLTPFILYEFNLNTSQIAIFLSVQGTSDIIFRFLAPFIGDALKLPPRQTYMVTLFMLMSTRFMLLISNDFKVLLGVALCLGVAKGVRTVYMSLVVPTYVPIEKLASASGLQMMINGVCILAGGPVIGWIRDITGSYSWCIVVLNAITFSTVLLWSIEYIIKRIKPEKEPTEVNDSLLK